ncbi:MAG: cyclic pyranopterin monophosphate synthase MoaC [Candidatus Omnitrophota bacterium]|nr:cyclic pyranopterin monophosphate synthase MoaC [Candidatus Omnitrophota bacterium]
MIDIGGKKITNRVAVVGARISLSPRVIKLIRRKKIPKGDVLETARVAGIIAAKKTAELIPFCHPVSIDYADIEVSLKNKEVEIKTTVRSRAKTGVEMEAFTACAIAALTVYDMCKAFDRQAVIKSIMLLKKSGGKNGDFVRSPVKTEGI